MRAAARGRGGIGTETILSDRLRPRAPRIALFVCGSSRVSTKYFFSNTNVATASNKWREGLGG